MYTYIKIINIYSKYLNNKYIILYRKIDEYFTKVHEMSNFNTLQNYLFHLYYVF